MMGQKGQVCETKSYPQGHGNLPSRNKNNELDNIPY
jgi:hypothetical protein